MSVGGMGKYANAGQGIIQADSIHNSIIYQLIDTVQKPTDIDQAIVNAGQHLHQLRRKKGWQDARIPLTILAALCVMVGLDIGWPHSLLLYTGAALAIVIGYALNSSINMIDSQIDAAQALLTEFYKIKLQHQLEAN